MPSGTRFTTSHRFCKILRWRWETFHYFVQLAANWIAVTSRLKQLHGRGSQLLAALLSKVFCDVSGLPPPTLQGLVYPSGMFMVKIWIAFWKIPFQILPTALSPGLFSPLWQPYCSGVYSVTSRGLCDLVEQEAWYIICCPTDVWLLY